MAAHEGLVHWVVRRQWRGELSVAEALHAGRIGLWRALRRYDPTRGTRFSSYAVPAIKRAVWAAVARQMQDGAHADAGARPGALTARDPVDTLHRAQVRAALHALVARLPARLQEVIVRHYGLGADEPQTFAAIGGPLGVSRQRVHQLHVTALLWLAQPDHSRALRRLLDRQRRTDYQQALARQRQHARAPRAGRRVRP
jgi:RNA polymerase sigma factor (sigma-70 family)